MKIRETPGQDERDFHRASSGHRDGGGKHFLVIGLCRVIHQPERHCAVVLELGEVTAGAGVIAEDDLIQADVAPRADEIVNRLQAGGFAFKFRHRDHGRAHLVVGLAGDRTHGLAVDQQVYAGFLGMIAASDEQADELALDGELRRCERSGGGVPGTHFFAGGGGVGVDRRFTVHREIALVGRHCGFGHRLGSEGGTGGDPFAVAVFKILEREVRPRHRCGFWGGGGVIEQGEPGLLHHPTGQLHCRLLPAEHAARVFKNSANRGGDRRSGLVFQQILHDRDRQRGIPLIQRNERRPGSERRLHRAIRVGVFHLSHRPFAIEGNLRPVGCLKLPGFARDFQLKPLPEWRRIGVGSRRLNVVRAILGSDLWAAASDVLHSLGDADLLLHHPGVRLIEDIPDKKPAIARQIDGAAANAAHRHSDFREVDRRMRRAQSGIEGMACLDQRSDPILGETFVGGHHAGVERAGIIGGGANPLAAKRGSQGCGGTELQKLAAVKRTAEGRVHDG